ncbi:chemotaxis protein CheC [Halovenus aranensis]|uniref:Chemotaxis protein CheC n=1 Tax=Halovenus aranensis TaxID=890420 RepID=A0A1G8V0C1_9EURY|nr:chemotaxis protein CheC [Halovenus aranensis]SDJ58640.1 chemotaxis protein CheC [Halovenus aranensis]
MPILIDIRKLTIIGKLIQHGAKNVTDSLSTMANIQADIQIKSLSFVEPSDIPQEIGEGDHYHANIRLTEPPYGVFLMTFGDRTAHEIAGHMTGQPVEDGNLNQMHESALQEMCNILTSGFIDGIANTLGTTINMHTPELERSDAEVIADQTLSHIHSDSLSIVLDSVVDLRDEDTEFQLRIFLVPDPGAFVNLIDKLDIEEIREIENVAAAHDGDRAF